MSNSTIELHEAFIEKTLPKNGEQKMVIRKLFLILCICLLFMSVEIVGGIVAKSIAILSDAAHLLSDVLGFAISILSVWMTGIPATKKHSYGYHRAGVIGALASTILIWGLTGFLIYFATIRLFDIHDIVIDGKIMFFTALFGVFVNVTMIYFLHRNHSHSHSHSGNIHKDHFHHNHKHEKNELDEIEKHIKNQEFDSHNLKQNEKEIANIYNPNGDLHKANNKCASCSSLEKDLEKEFKVNIKQELPHFPQSPIINPGNEYNYVGAENCYNHPPHHSSQAHPRHEEKDLSKNLNMRATLLHIFGDLLQSIGVLVASILVWWDDDLKLADPICTYIFSVIVLFTTIPITKECIHVLMESTPKDINLENFEAEILSVQGIVDLHDIHVWSLSEGKQAMSAHVTADVDPQSVLESVTKICREFGITHSTVQIEKIGKNKSEFILNCEQFIH